MVKKLIICVCILLFSTQVEAKSLFHPGQSNRYREYVECPGRHRDNNCADLVNEYISLTTTEIKINGDVFHNPTIYEALRSVRRNEIVMIGALVSTRNYNPGTFSFQFLRQNTDMIAVASNVRNSNPYIVIDNIVVIEFHIWDKEPHLVILKNPTIASVYNNYFFMAINRASVISDREEHETSQKFKKENKSSR